MSQTNTINLEDCWLWAGSLNNCGYGRFRLGIKAYAAHRVVYESEVGLIPDGLVIDHLCRTPCCVNPEHLEPVTNKENILRGTAPSAVHARKTHCPRGHEYNEKNTYYQKKGGRQCRPCAVIIQRKRRQKHDNENN